MCQILPENRLLFPKVHCSTTGIEQDIIQCSWPPNFSSKFYSWNRPEKRQESSALPAAPLHVNHFFLPLSM